MSKNVALQQAVQHMLEWPKPYLEASEDLGEQNSGLQGNLQDFHHALDEVGDQTKNLLGRINKAFELTRAPVSLLLSAAPCPSVEEAANEAHQLHLQVGRVKSSIKTVGKFAEPKVMGSITKMRHIVDRGLGKMDKQASEVLTA
ncbi:unnamed protein product [Amoebophrya sp. A120]|nr:unnamed protein product [Amoebophrya sp. A120]|eukprot:GSA120T00002384001.1